MLDAATRRMQEVMQDRVVQDTVELESAPAAVLGSYTLQRPGRSALRSGLRSLRFQSPDRPRAQTSMDNAHASKVHAHSSTALPKRVRIGRRDTLW